MAQKDRFSQRYLLEQTVYCDTGVVVNRLVRNEKRKTEMAIWLLLSFPFLKPTYSVAYLRKNG
jgi:hypothetical protein